MRHNLAKKKTNANVKGLFNLRHDSMDNAARTCTEWVSNVGDNYARILGMKRAEPCECQVCDSALSKRGRARAKRRHVIVTLARAHARAQQTHLYFYINESRTEVFLTSSSIAPIISLVMCIHQVLFLWWWMRGFLCRWDYFERQILTTEFTIKLRLHAIVISVNTVSKSWIIGKPGKFLQLQTIWNVHLV